MGLTYVGGLNHDVHAPDVSVYIRDNATNATYPSTGPVKTDLRGEYVIPNLPSGNNYDTYCQPPGTSTPSLCSAGFFVLDHLTIPSVATSDYLSSYPGLDFSVSDFGSGNVALQDGSPCGTLNEFFGVHSTATATLLDAAGNPMGTQVRANELGDYTLTYDYTAMPAAVSVQCEAAPPVVVAFTPQVQGNEDFGTTVIPNASAPQVQSMTATLNGSTFVTPDLQTPPSLPSAIISRADTFLAEKGLDTRPGAASTTRPSGR